MVVDFQIEVPIDINSLKVGQWQDYLDRYEDLKGRLPKEPTQEEVREFNELMNLAMVSIFCEMKEEDIKELPFEAYDVVLEHLNTILSEETPLVRRFSLVGADGVEVEFGLIPNLSKMTTGEYMDLDSYMGDGVRSMNKAMAVLYRPIHKSFRNKEDYRVMEYKGTDRFAEVMRDMPLGYALGAQVFFYRLGMKLSTRTLSYFLEQIERENLSQEQRKLLEKNTDGIRAYMRWHKEMYLDLMKLQTSPSIKP